jgi:hypothetical protein
MPQGLQQHLNLDDFVLEPNTIDFPDGTSIVIRDFETNEEAEYLQKLRQIGEDVQRDDDAPPRLETMADLISTLAEDVQSARDALDHVPVVEIPMIIQWLQTLNTPHYRVADINPISSITYKGKQFSIYPLLLRDYSRGLDLLDAAMESSSGQERMRASLNLVAAMVKGMTVEQLIEMPRQMRKALENFVNASVDKMQEGIANIPSQRTSRRRRSSA